MTELSCKNCTAPLDMAEAKNGVIACSFCGSVFTLPKSGQTDEVKRLIDAGKTALDVCRFDEALTAFGKAVELDGSEPEAYWGRALARFRVQYLRDTVNNRLQPICHEVAEDAFTSDPDYKKALELATDEQRAAYGKKGEEIDYIRSEFYALAQSGLTYDCFICVKVTDDADGRPTADSRSADRIFRALEGSGYKPFYSEYETGARTGADYEALILYALHKAPCMLVVCSDAKYLETKWVKNEYTRYLAMLADGDKERSSITIAYRGRVVERLPGVRGKIQGIDLSEVAAIDRIRAFIDSHDADKQRKKAEREAADKAERARAAEEKAEAERKAREAAEQRAAEMERRLKELEAAQNESKSAPKAKSEPAPKPAPKAAPAKPAAKDESKSVPKSTPKSVPKAERPAPKPAGTSGSAESAPATHLTCKSCGGRLKYMPDGTLQCDSCGSRYRAPKEDQTELEPFQLKCKKCGGRLEYMPDGMLQCNLCGSRYKAPKEDQPAPAAPSDFEIENGVLVRYRGKGGDVTVPAGVTSIGDEAFRGCSGLTGITLPASVTVLERGAFSGCSGLTGITLPAGVKSIAPRAFSGCVGLTSVTIPDGVTGIGGEAFRECSRLTGITLPASVTEIGRGAFEGCSGLADIALPAGLTEIGNSAFSGCSSLTGITLPAGVRKIGDAAFKGCGKLTGMTLPAGVAIIGAWAFAGCSGITAVTIPASATSVGGGAFDTPGMTVTVDLPARPSGWATAWTGPEVNVRWKNSGTVPAPSSAAPKPAAPVTSAKPASKPAGTSPLSDFEIKNGVLVKYRGKGGDVTVPAGVTSIGYNAFNECNNVSSITLPDGLRSIEPFAFDQCGRLTSVSIPGSVTSIGKYAFNRCGSLISITLPDGVTRIEEYTFSYCDNLTSVTLPNGLRSIENYAFNCCSSLTSVPLPAGLTEIGESAFWECNSLTNVTIPATVTKMGKFAFTTSNRMTVAVDLPARPAGWDVKWAGALVTVRWKKSGSAPAQSSAAPKPAAPVTSAKPAPKPAVASSPSSDFEIKDGVLVSYRGKGGDVAVPAGVTVIGDRAFYQCSEITSLTIPVGIKSIGRNAFERCYGLTGIDIPGSVEKIGDSAFWGCNRLERVFVGDGTKSIGECAFKSCSALTDVRLPASVTEIGWDAFRDIPAGATITVRGKKPWHWPEGWQRSLKKHIVWKK